ncbi:MAG: threonine-phosphate decarboxylase [Pseudomonadota bacterium]
MTGPLHTRRDHGGGLDAAVARFGGLRAEWLDLSTGINPVPYPVGDLPSDAWTALPDTGAMNRVLSAARSFWNVPDTAEIVAAPGASAIIAQMPGLANGKAYIPQPTYNEHAAAFSAHGRIVAETPAAPIHVHVHPNNPDGRLWDGRIGDSLTVIDESFCDTAPELSQTARAAEPGVVVLKSFGKFWGLAGLRLGFAIGRPATLAPDGHASLAERLGPWAVPGPALEIGARALEDLDWAYQTRERLRRDADRLDDLMIRSGANLVGGTTLFRTYAVDGPEALQAKLAQHRIWTRVFPYSKMWIRFGLPGTEADWQRLDIALK